MHNGQAQSLVRPFDKRFCCSTNCKKPLPRCSLCMYHLGTTSRFNQNTKGTYEQNIRIPIIGLTPILQYWENPVNMGIGGRTQVDSSLIKSSRTTPIIHPLYCPAERPPDQRFNITSLRLSAAERPPERFMSHEQQQRKQQNTVVTRTNPLGDWFVWCLACGHGCHSDHMADWFR